MQLVPVSSSHRELYRMEHGRMATTGIDDFQPQKFVGSI